MDSPITLQEDLGSRRRTYTPISESQNAYAQR